MGTQGSNIKIKSKEKKENWPFGLLLFWVTISFTLHWESINPVFPRAKKPKDMPRNHWKEKMLGKWTRFLSCLRTVCVCSRLELEMDVRCLEFYWGPNCATYCRPRDTNSGHYTCANDGSKVCRPGKRDRMTFHRTMAKTLDKNENQRKKIQFGFWSLPFWKRRWSTEWSCLGLLASMRSWLFSVVSTPCPCSVTLFTLTLHRLDGRVLWWRDWRVLEFSVWSSRRQMHRYAQQLLLQMQRRFLWYDSPKTRSKQLFSLEIRFVLHESVKDSTTDVDHSTMLFLASFCNLSQLKLIIVISCLGCEKRNQASVELTFLHELWRKFTLQEKRAWTSMSVKMQRSALETDNVWTPLGLTTAIARRGSQVMQTSFFPPLF